MGNLVYGVGYSTSGNGRYSGTKRTKPYTMWHNMLRRSYSHNVKAYDSCRVDESWFDFDNFLNWFDGQNYVDGFQLDKDLFSGSVYSPETCCLISPRMNKFIELKNRVTGPIGCYYSEEKRQFKAMMLFSRKKETLGWFDDIDECYECYRAKKKELLLTLDCFSSHSKAVKNELLSMRWLDRAFKESLNQRYPDKE